MTPITREDIERLRRRIERVEGGRLEPNPVRPRPVEPEDVDLLPVRYDADRALDGRQIENGHGRCFVSERLYGPEKLHGSYEVSRLAELRGEWLAPLTAGEAPPVGPERWAFLDTETTGLAGGVGTCAFLVGVGSIEPDCFRVRLFFMRDYDEEAAMLEALSDHLARFDVLVTYNGKSYDSPLLETRYRLRRLANPLDRLGHLDLLHGARSLFKLRLESCRLMRLENELLGVERHGDLPGELIPYYYFEYLRTKQAFKLVPLFHHNTIDILSLACLTAYVLPAFAAPDEAPLRYGADLLGLARWLRRSGDRETAVRLYRRAIEAGMADAELFAALWETALLEKREGRREQMLALLHDLADARNAFQARACEELAKHHERIAKDFAAALRFTDQALALEPTEALTKRRERLVRRLARRPKKAALLPAF